MPRKASNVKDLLSYKPIAKEENKADIDEVVRLYKTKKMVFSMATKTAKQLIGNKRQVAVARTRMLEYAGKQSKSDKMKAASNALKQPIKVWYVKGTLKLKVVYKNKHSHKEYEDEVPEALAIRARSAEEAVDIFKNMNAHSLSNEFYEYDQKVEGIEINSVKSEENFRNQDDPDRPITQAQLKHAKTIYHHYLRKSLMRSASHVVYDFIPQDDSHLKNEGFCVDDQFLAIYGHEAVNGIKRLTPEYFQELCRDSLREFDDEECQAKADQWKPEDGKTPEMLFYVCKQFNISHYAFDITKRCFMKYVSTSRNHPALVYYCVNNHMYWISDQEAVRKLTSEARDIEHKIKSAVMDLSEDKPNKNPYEGRQIYENIPIKDLMSLEDKNCIVIYDKIDLNDELDQIIEHYNYIPLGIKHKGGFKICRINFKPNKKTNIMLEIDPNRETRKLTYKDIKQMCKKFEIGFENQSFGTFVMQLRNKFFNKNCLRHAFTKEERQRIHQDAFEQCNECKEKITIKAMHIDHIVPIARGGHATDRENLQCLCRKCHFQKTKQEQQEGYVKMSETYSSFNAKTYEIFNSPLSQSKAFVERYGRLEEFPEKMRKFKIYSFDINKSRKNNIYYSKYEWPQFTCMDEPVRYVPDSGKVPGIYYVETESYLPLRGNGWYSQPMVEYCLEHEYIKEADIKYVVKAGIRIKKDYFNNFIDYVYENFDEKMAKFAINTMIGCFKPKEKTNWKTLAITTNSNESFNLLMQHNGCFIEDRRIRDQHYYHTYTSYTTRNEETESPIYNMIIDMEAIELDRLMKVVWDAEGYSLDLKTDCVSCVFKKYRMPFTLEEGSRHLKGYYWDAKGKVPKYKLEEDTEVEEKKREQEEIDKHRDKGDVEREKEMIERLPRYRRTAEYEHKEEAWKVMEDDGSNDFKPWVDRILDNNMSVHVKGTAGAGKSTLVVELQKAMKERSIKYVALAPTNKACRIIDGKTIHRWSVSATGEQLKDKSLKYIFVDEVSMVAEMFYKFFCTLKRMRPDLKFIMSGDFRQFKPVNDRVKHCDYENSSALKELCECNMLHLTKCRRSDDKLFNMCKEENIGKVKASDFGSKLTDRHICYTNEKRKELNEQMMNKEAKTKASRYKATVIELKALEYDSNSQDVKVFTGLPIIARVNTDVAYEAKNDKKEVVRMTAKICNNESFVVKEVRKKSEKIVIIPVRDDEEKPEEGFYIEFKMFQKLFYPAYAITSHKAQGSTYKKPYTIWEWSHRCFDETAKYVVLSRASKFENINVID